MKREIWRNFDYWLFAVVLVLCVFGIVMITSALAGNPAYDAYASPFCNAFFAVFGHLAERLHIEVRHFFDAPSVVVFVPAVYRDRNGTYFAAVRRLFK